MCIGSNARPCEALRNDGRRATTLAIVSFSAAGALPSPPPSSSPHFVVDAAGAGDCLAALHGRCGN